MQNGSDLCMHITYAFDLMAGFAMRTAHKVITSFRIEQSAKRRNSVQLRVIICVTSCNSMQNRSACGPFMHCSQFCIIRKVCITYALPQNLAILHRLSKVSFWDYLYAVPVPVMWGARIHRTERTETDDDASGVRYGIFMTRQIKVFKNFQRLRQHVTTFTSCKIAWQEPVAYAYDAGSAM